jgi:ACDE family multidrug resistance protein
LSRPEPLARPAAGAGRGAPPPVAMIFSITVTGILASAVVGPAIPDILDHFDQPDGRAGLFVAAITLPGILVAPIIGILADRYGRRAVLVPCLVVFGVAGVAGAAAPSFEVLIGLRLLQGLGSAGLINLAVVIIGDNWTGLDRSRIIARNAAVLTLSLAVLPPLGGALALLGGWRLVFAPYGLALITAVRMWRRLDEVRPADPGTVGDQLRVAGASVRQAVVAMAIASGFVVFVLIFGLFLTTLPLHLEREFGLEAGARGLVIAAPALTAMVGALALARLRGRFGVAAVLAAAPALFAVGFLLIGSADTLPVLVVGALVYGLGEGIFIPVLQDLVVSSAAAEARGAVNALWVGAARAGQTVGPLLAGVTYEATTTGTTFVLGGALAAVLLAGQSVARLGSRAAGGPAGGV